MKRKASIYNMLAVSAFLLLVIDPYIITQVGFQLSYLAVTGIVLLHKPISGLLVFHYWLPDKIWQMSVVSITATLATFPLSLYNFNQFPNLFLLTNLVAIPASFMIVYLGILVLFTSFVPVVSGMIAKVLSGVLWFLNYVVGAIEGLSFATSSNIHITQTEFLALFGILICLVSLLFIPKKRYLFVGLGLLVLLVSSFTFRKDKYAGQQQIIVYNIPGHTTIDFVYGNESVFLCDTVLMKDPLKISYKINGFRTENAIKRTEAVNVHEQKYKNEQFNKLNGFISFGGKTIVIIDEKSGYNTTDSVFEADVLVLRNNPSCNLNQLRNTIQFKTLVLDGSFSSWKKEEWINECEQIGVDCYSITDDGAWLKKIN